MSVETSEPARLRRERGPAAAGGGRVGIGELEAAAIQAVDEVDHYAGQIGSAAVIDVNLHTISVQDHVVGPLLIIEIELVRETRAAAVGHGDP